MDKYETTLAAGISQPRNNRGNYWTSNVSHNHSTTQNLEKRALTSGIWYVRDRNNIDARFGLGLITETAKSPTPATIWAKPATMLTASWKRQSIETELHPQNGYYLDGKIRATLGKFLSSTQMARAMARAGYFFTPKTKKLGTFIVRGQAGYVYAARVKKYHQPDVPHRRRNFRTRLRTRQHRLAMAPTAPSCRNAPWWSAASNINSRLPKASPAPSSTMSAMRQATLNT